MIATCHQRHSRIWPAATICAVLAATAAGATELPSGVTPVLHEVLLDEVGGAPLVRFRFLVPEIARGGETPVTFFDAEEDFALLCADVALPYLAHHGIQTDQLVISYMDRIVEFGTSDPEATQFFEGFRVENGLCMWESF